MPARVIVRERGKPPREVPVGPGEPVEILPSLRVSAAEVPGVVLEASPLRIHAGGRAVPPGERWLLAPGEDARVGAFRVQAAWEEPGTAAEARALLLAALRGEVRGTGPFLVVRGGPLAGRRLPARDGVLGRAPGAAVQVEEGSVSRAHARLLLVDGGRLRVEDLGSRNGTWRGSRRLGPGLTLRPGEPFRAGRTVLALGLEPATAGPARSSLAGTPYRVRAPRIALAAALLAALAAALAALSS